MGMILKVMGRTKKRTMMRKMSTIAIWMLTWTMKKGKEKERKRREGRKRNLLNQFLNYTNLRNLNLDILPIWTTRYEPQICLNECNYVLPQLHLFLKEQKKNLTVK